MFKIGDILTLRNDTLLWVKGTVVQVVSLECDFDDKCDIVVKILDTKGMLDSMLGKEVGAVSYLFDLQERRGGILV